jgi:septal ring factor EnvC (AmiA/AmiB activator)
MAPLRRSWVLRLLGVVAAGSVAASLALPHDAGAQAAAQAADVPTQLKQVKAALADVKADAKKLARALDRANQALNRAENELEEAELQRLGAHARGVRATAGLQDATVRVERLRRVLGDRARGIYMGGDPAGLSALVRNDRVDQLLSQVTMLDHLARESNESLADLVIAQQDYALAKQALGEAERDARRAGAIISRKIAEAVELRDLRLQAKEKLDDKIRLLEGEEAVLRATQQQRLARQAGVVRGGGTCDLSGTSDAEYFIIMKESRGDPTADNPTSTAFGLGQLLLDLRRRYLGANYDTIDCGLQLMAFRSYVRDRYGTAEAARAFWLSHGWY